MVGGEAAVSAVTIVGRPRREELAGAPLDPRMPPVCAPDGPTPTRDGRSGR
jgi:hypothetical protein